MLASLIRQQEQRRLDLKNLVSEMETQRRDQAADYWLVQYQRLLENAPSGIGRNSTAFADCSTPTAPPFNSTSLSALPQPSAPPAEYEACAPIAKDVFHETVCVICIDNSVICLINLILIEFNHFN